MSTVPKSDTLKTKKPVTQVLMSDKKLPPKKRTVSQTVKNSTHLSESKSASYEKEGTNKKKLTNAPNTTTRNAKPDVKGRLDQNKIARNPQAKKVVSRNTSTAFNENHVSLRAKQVSKPTIVLKTTGQKPTTSQKPLNSLKEKKNIIQKKNAVLDTPHNVTVTSPPSKRKNDPNEIASNSDRKADTFKLIRKGSRTLAPDEIVVLKRESAKMRSEEAIQKENTQTDQTLTTNIKEPVAFEVKFDDKDKKEKTICNEKTPSLAGRQKSDEELNYSDDFESYESDFETGSSTSTLSIPSTSSDINRKLSDEEANQEDSHCQITSDEGEQDDDADVPQKSLFDLPTDKERKLDSGNYDTSSRKINAYRPSELAVQSSQPQTGSWETTSLGISEQMDSGISTCATIMSCSHNKRNIEVIFGGYRYFYMKPIISSRGCELKTKIQFDVLSFTLIELKPISYEIFMQTFGKMNTNQNFTQTQDNQMNVEQQTEIYETRSVWTQHPPQFVLEISKSCDKNGKYNQLSCGEDFDKNEEQLMPYCELEQNLNAMKWLNTQNYKRENELNRNRQRMPINYQNLNSFLLRSSLLIDQILGSSKTNTKTNPIANDAFKNDQVLQRVCEKSFYMETNFLNTLRVVKIFSNNKFNLLITVHESLPDTNVYSSDFSNLLMVWCTNTCDKPLRLLTTWSEVSKVEIPNDSSDIVIAALRDGSIAMWDLRETHSFCSKLDGYLTHFAATQSIVPTYSADNGSKELESDLGACLDVKSFKSPTNNILMQTTFPKIQFVSLHDSGIVTVWTLVQTSEITFNLAPVAQTIQVFDSISPWARVKLMQSSIINIKEFLEMKSIHSRSRFDKTMDFFQKNIYCDESLRELNENIAEVGRDGIRFTSLECGSENIFICTNRNFILMCSKTLKIDRLKRIFIDDSQFLFPTALKILNNDRYLAVGLSNGVVMILNCQSDRVTKSNKEQMKKSELSKHIVTDRDPTLNNSLTSKSCAIQNILLNVQKSCEQMDSSQDYRPSTAACLTLIDSKRKPFELRIIDQQVIMSGSALRKNLIQLLELSSDGWYLFALANGHVRIYDFYLEQELPSEESPEPGKIIDLATGKCGCKENNLMILRPKTEVEVIILKQ